MTHKQQSISYALSDSAIAHELGQRLEQLRLEKNIDQQTLADELGITRKTYRALAHGEGKLVNFIKAMRVLGELEQLDKLLPATTFSPIELLKLQGKQRQRARTTTKTSSKHTHSQPEEDLDW
jgi:transcriptional regulator with XRE-family HTH domain